jgi:hypothetical protein
MAAPYYLKPGERWMFSHETEDIVGLRDPDGSERMFVFTSPNTEQIQELHFDTDNGAADQTVGAVQWGADSGTLDIQHDGGVRQPIGERLYVRVVNNTEAAFYIGQVVGYNGVEEDRMIEATPYIADGSAPSVYFLGVVAQEIGVGEGGRVCVFGRVPGVDTTGFALGSVLYASPAEAGVVTSVKPTAPAIAIPVGVVVIADSVDGGVMVRPVIEQTKYYGLFTQTVDSAPAEINTAYAIELVMQALSVGVSLADSTRITVSHAGLYELKAEFQVRSSSATQTDIRFWVRKNGGDVPYTSRVQTVSLNGGYTDFRIAEFLSLEAGEYVEIMWAASRTTVMLKSAAATEFAPGAPAVRVALTQIQQ